VVDSISFFNILISLNETLLDLIPKEYQDGYPKKFIPISLCNVAYKIITKVIANRLKPILPNLILEEQTCYMEGTQILDGIILANEIIHSLKTTKTT